MCGIAGYVGDAELHPDRLQGCLALMHRRGPDCAAVYQHRFRPGRNVYLLHSRLSIIDLDERSNQPFRSGSKVLTFNGELYNYPELKQELGRQGLSFSTSSDTEVLLKTITRFGWEGLDQCEGMWAFALYDEHDGRLLLGRDRFGEKPLYLYRDATGLYFGSEVKFIFALLGRSLELNYAHLYRYMVNGYKSLYKVQETFFLGIQEFQRASVLLIDPTGSEQQRLYWKPSYEQNDTMTYEQAVEGVRSALADSVRLRLRADVPLAFCMSGGLDSISLISVAKRLFRYDVHGFTIMNEDPRYEERRSVEQVVQELGIRHTYVPLTTDCFLENLSQLIRQHDAPVYTISYYLHWLLMSQVAKEGYRVSVSGTGADELLTGYYDHHNLYLYEIRNSPSFQPALEAWTEHIAPLVRNPHLKNPRLYVENPDFRDHVFLNREDFSRYLTQGWSEEFLEARYTDSLLRNRMLNELFHEGVPVILHEDDLNAMYFSIENRSPYLDRRLFEFCYSIPTRYLVRQAFTKVILRDAMSGIVPNSVLWNHRKVGFNAPILSLLDIRNPDIRAAVLDDSPIFEHVRKEKIESLMNKSELPNSESKFLFYFLCSKIFLELYAECRTFAQ